MTARRELWGRRIADQTSDHQTFHEVQVPKLHSIDDVDLVVGRIGRRRTGSPARDRMADSLRPGYHQPTLIPGVH